MENGSSLYFSGAKRTNINGKCPLFLGLSSGYHKCTNIDELESSEHMPGNILHFYSSNNGNSSDHNETGEVNTLTFVILN